MRRHPPLLFLWLAFFRFSPTTESLAQAKLDVLSRSPMDTEFYRVRRVYVFLENEIRWLPLGCDKIRSAFISGFTKSLTECEGPRGRLNLECENSMLSEGHGMLRFT